jgi:hypothetical protein
MNLVDQETVLDALSEPVFDLESAVAELCCLVIAHLDECQSEDDALAERIRELAFRAVGLIKPHEHTERRPEAMLIGMHARRLRAQPRVR